MTVERFASELGFSVLCMPCPDRNVSGAYVGDLLSWVMGRAGSDNVWITIMSNVNVAAVATLADVSCVLLAEGVTLESEVLATAESKGVNVLSTPLSAFDAAKAVSSLV